MTWTSVPKPTSSTYGFVNPQGKEFYDDANIIYDDPNVFYDGIDEAAWTDIGKPTGGGAFYGIAVYGVDLYGGGSGWNKINKPT